MPAGTTRLKDPSQVEGALPLPHHSEVTVLGHRPPDLHLVGPDAHRWIIPLDQALVRSNLLHQLVGSEPLADPGRLDVVSQAVADHLRVMPAPIHAPALEVGCYACGRGR